MHADKSQGQYTYSREYNTPISNMGATTVNLLRLLQSVDNIGWNTHKESGRVDLRALTRMANGSPDIFKTRAYKPAIKTAVHLMVDCSGSMTGRDIRMAQSVSIQLAKIFARTNCAWAITGFNGEDRLEYLDSNPLSESTCMRKEKVRLIPFKEWGESLQHSAPKLGLMHMMADDSTPDYSAVYLGLQSLLARKEQKRILFVLTDSAGFNVEHMRYVESIAKKHAIKLVGIGINAQDIHHSFSNSVNVTRIGQLGSTAFSKLLETVNKG
jgi:cobalamin biosynthesis protein CobT